MHIQRTTLFMYSLDLSHSLSCLCPHFYFEDIMAHVRGTFFNFQHGTSRVKSEKEKNVNKINNYMYMYTSSGLFAKSGNYSV